MDRLEEELRENDRQEFSRRLTRFREIDEWFQVPPGGLSLGSDWEATLAFQEARFAYVSGLWISAILCAGTALERHLAWRLMHVFNKNTEHLKAKEITDSAMEAGLIDRQQADEISKLRSYRNAHAHFRRDSRYVETLHAQMESLRDDESVDGVDANLVLRPEARAAVMLASAYFLAAGIDESSHPEEPGS